MLVGCPAAFGRCEVHHPKIGLDSLSVPFVAGVVTLVAVQIVAFAVDLGGDLPDA